LFWIKGTAPELWKPLSNDDWDVLEGEKSGHPQYTRGSDVGGFLLALMLADDREVYGENPLTAFHRYPLRANDPDLPHFSTEAQDLSGFPLHRFSVYKE
jgi:hypothetical protein|tara:strand:- start:173 stop:469 length:297 start_codon:yes stop_codon:yes gene_type:complete